MGVATSEILALLWSYVTPGFITLALIYGTHRYIRDKLFYRRLPPGPMPLPFIGSLWAMKAKSLEQTLDILAQQYNTDILTFYCGPYRMVHLADAKIIHENMEHEKGKVFNSRFEKHNIAGCSGMGDGIAMASGPPWRRHRRFGLRAMRDFGMGKEVMVHRIHDEIQNLIPTFSAQKGKPFNPHKILINATSNVICALAFGKRYDSMTDPQFLALMKPFECLMDLSLMVNALLMMFPFLNYIMPPPQLAAYIQLFKIIRGIVGDKVEEHRKDFDPSNIRDFPDMFILVQAKEKREELLENVDMTLEDFCYILVDMFIAGTETTSTALAWTLLYLGKYPDVQQKCHEIIDEVIESDRLPTLADRQKLVYIEAVMHEVMRHATMLPLAGNFHCNIDTDTTINGYDVPANSMVSYHVERVHNDPNYWDKPREFNPNRWIDADGKFLPHHSHFLIFGLGPRVCLGESMARVEFFMFLTALLHRFEFKLVTKNVSVEDGKRGIIHAPPHYEILAESRN